MRLFVLALVFGALALQREAQLPHARLELLGVAFLLACRFIPRGQCAVRATVVLAGGALIGYGYSAWRAKTKSGQ